jgi:group I intron endonuclease
MNPLPVSAGFVYAIRNTANGGMYIGSTTNFKSRWGTHRSALRNGRHHSFILQKAWDKHGEHNFVFEVLCVCAKEQRIEYENRLMPLQRYNVLRTAREQLVRGGWKHTEAFKQKMSFTHKGKPLSGEHKARVAAAKKGMKMNAAFCEKARQRQTGFKPSAKTRQMLSEAVTVARANEKQKNQEIVRKIHAQASAGKSILSLCKQYNVSPQTFYTHCKVLGLELLGRKRSNA